MLLALALGDVVLVARLSVYTDGSGRVPMNASWSMVASYLLVIWFGQILQPTPLLAVSIAAAGFTVLDTER